MGKITLPRQGVPGHGPPAGSPSGKPAGTCKCIPSSQQCIFLSYPNIFWTGCQDNPVHGLHFTLNRLPMPNNVMSLHRRGIRNKPRHMHVLPSKISQVLTIRSHARHGKQKPCGNCLCHGDWCSKSVVNLPVHIRDLKLEVRVA